MTKVSGRREERGRVRVHSPRSGLGAGGRRVAAGLLPILGFVALALSGPGLIRATTPTLTVAASEVTGGAPSAEPVALTATAAELLEQSTADGGAGYRFEILQRSTLVAKPGGPLISIPDPASRTKTLGEADRYEVASLVEAGFVSPGGFSMDMRTGPAAGDETVDVTKGDLVFRALVREGKTYRDDGKGWYPTDQPPGIGLDPATAALLPRLLRNAGQPTDTELATAEGDLGKDDQDAARAITATGKVEDIPGVIAVDGAPFTELTAPVAMTFDEAGRLVGLLVTARQTSVEAYDLVVVTEITLHYDDIPQVLPLPEPAWTDAGEQQVAP